MRFEIKRTTATFAVPRIRREKNKGNAADIPFRITTDVHILAMLTPAHVADNEDDNPESWIQELFTSEGYVRRPSINPIKIHRRPEGATVYIFDEPSQNTKKRSLLLKPCRLVKLQAELKAPYQVVLSGEIQYPQYTDQELIRINALTDKNFDINIVIEQLDMFEQPELNENDEGEGGDEEESDAEADEEQEDPEE